MSLYSSHEGVPLRSPFKRDPVVSWHLQLLHLWDLPHLHGSHALPGMLLANSWAQFTRVEASLPVTGLLHWVVFAPGLPISLAETFSEQHYRMRLFLPNPPSAPLSSHKCQACITVQRLSLPTPASSPLHPPQTFP